MTQSAHPHDAIVAIYEARSRAIDAEIERIERLVARIAYARVTTFLTGAALIACAIWGHPSWLPEELAMSGAAFLAFFALVIWHARVYERVEHWRARLAFNRESIAAIRREWDRLPVSTDAASEAHPYAHDLDVLGRASLLQLVSRGATVFGRRTIVDWLLAPAPPEAIGLRQHAIAALASELDLREELAAWARLIDADQDQLERFLSWAEGEPWLLRRPVLLWLVRSLTAATIATIVLQATGVIRIPLWSVTGLVALVLSWIHRGRVAGTFNHAAAGEQTFHRYARLLARAGSARIDSPLVRELQALLRRQGVPVATALRRFDALVDRSNLRYSAALFHLAIQAVTLWDFHVLAGIERWQQTYGRDVRRWLSALGELEALNALAGLRHDNPDWIFPAMSTGTARFDARDLGHPLIGDAERVVNDVEIGPPGTVLLITGSNMSGKSTLLRAIGLNAVLAQAGAPVCASAMTLTAVRLYTSMTVQDSLEQGVSYFMAALTRLKQIVDAARQPGVVQVGPDPHAAAVATERAPLLYLLDEILQGTNSAERQVAVRRVLTFLLQQPAIGAVTTHDLELATVEPLASAAHAVHFSEQFRQQGNREVMSFDYRLQPGVATSRNALKLMELIGLPDRVATDRSADRQS